MMCRHMVCPNPFGPGWYCIKCSGEFETNPLQEKKMSLHPSTFEYLKPTDEQIAQMAKVREAARIYAEILDAALPEGPDKTYILRAHRSNAMWANVNITRLPDGTPRE